jgi:hypothetical protein
MKQTFLLRLPDPREGSGGGDNDTEQAIRDSAVAEDLNEAPVDDLESTDEEVVDEDAIDEDTEANAAEIADDDEA